MTLPSTFFDEFYSHGSDPWGFTDRFYEQRKYALTLAALPRSRYRSAFEPGCSVGVLTSLLAQRCGTVLATDVAQAALDRAAARVPANVTLRRWGLTEPWAGERHDLIVLSEVGYYLSADDLAAALNQLVGALHPGGTLVAVHWRHPVAEYPLTGDAVHSAVRATPGLVRLGGWADADLLLDVLERSPSPVASVAEREGLV